MSIDLLI